MGLNSAINHSGGNQGMNRRTAFMVMVILLSAALAFAGGAEKRQGRRMQWGR